MIDDKIVNMITEIRTVRHGVSRIIEQIEELPLPHTMGMIAHLLSARDELWLAMMSLEKKTEVKESPPAKEHA